MNRPWWWLLFATSFYLPIQVTFGLLSLVLVPADVATIVGAENKAQYLGVTVTIMMVIQNCQPIFGSVSDKTRSRFGRRVAPASVPSCRRGGGGGLGPAHPPSRAVRLTADVRRDR